MTHPLDRLMRAARTSCPFCSQWVAPPARITEVHRADGALGGRCSCGAVFVVDETGRSGGQALLDAQTFAVGGDVDEAMKLETNVHVDVETRDYVADPRSLMGRRGPLRPKVWFVRLRSPQSQS